MRAGFLRVLGLVAAVLASLTLVACVGGERAASVDEAVPVTGSMRVLFVGSSLTFYNNMPATVAALALANGTRVEHAMVAPGGSILIERAVDPKLWDELRTGDYDVVVVQENSTAAGLPRERERDTRPALRAISALAADAGTEVVLFQAWGYRNGEAQGGHGTYGEMQREIIRTYEVLQADSGAPVAAVGEAWWDSLSFHPDIVLHDADSVHPSPAGSYLAALVIAGTLLGEPVEHVTAFGQIGETTALRLRDIAG